MKTFYFIIFISFSSSIIIDNAVYIFFYKNYYFNYENETIQISKNLKEQINSNFRIKKLYNYLNHTFFNIIHINTNLNLISYKNGTLNVKSNVIDNIEILDEWTFIEINTNEYKIKNKNMCYIKIRNSFITCEIINLEEASTFNAFKIYEEANEMELDIEKINKEPIDLVIKYIDLRDPFLKRNGIHQIQKDFDNEELRYSIRSILKYIPWIRKIYILMPNEKVRFFKEYNIIKDKIIYIKDKDILGYDSSNSLAFQFRYWKLKIYGISNNIIAMDDDCFIGQYLNKNDFFYINNGNITPFIITNKFIELNYNSAETKIKEIKKIINKVNQEQTSSIFRYSLYSTYAFILKKYKQIKYVPIHTHNAIPINLNELKEIYDLIYQSEYKNPTLFVLYRHINSLQFQAFVLTYTLIKYNKKVKNISYNLIQNKYSIFSDYNYSLFCINTGAINYTNLSFMKSKIVMDYLFPIPTPYEINDYSLQLLAFNTIYFIEQEFMKKKQKYIQNIKQLENRLIIFKKKKENMLILTSLSLLFFILYFIITFYFRIKKFIYFKYFK